MSLMRARVGAAAGSFNAMTAHATSTLVDETVPAMVREKEEAALRKRFKEFRTAFNNGDSEALAAMWSDNCDAIVAFSFLQGRAQIINGKMAVGSKADRMAAGATVSNPNPMSGPIGGIAGPMATGAGYMGPAGEAGGLNTGALKKRSGGAVIVAGEPKVIRFVSATVAVVDGTAEIGNIPAAHGFTPREMNGVYTDVWRKNQGVWQIEGSRPWF
jgi:ketosteroid isomerase-like protein